MPCYWREIIVKHAGHKQIAAKSSSPGKITVVIQEL